MKSTLLKFESHFKRKKQLYEALHLFDISRYKYRKEYRLQLAKNLISAPNTAPFLASISKIDLFATMKIKPNENQISDVIASLLNPKTSIWGQEILLKLIDKYGHNKQLHKLLKDTPRKNFYVRREWSGEYSRIDIRILTKNRCPEKNIIIDFEMKIGSGEETISNGIFQTQREWNDLEKIANLKKIPKTNVIAFFVSPFGTTPRSNKFISIRYSSLNNLIKKTMLNCNSSSSSLEQKYAYINFISSRYIFQE